MNATTRKRSFGIILILVASATVVSAQSSVKPGDVVSGGGGGTSTNARLVGTVGGGPLGVGLSSNYRLGGGVAAALPAPLVFAVTPLAANPPAGTAIAINATVSNGTGATLNLYYRLGGRVAWTGPVAMTSSDGLAFQGTIPAGAVGLRGVEYYVEATQGGATATQPANPSLSPYSAVVALANHAAPVLPDAVFRMVGFPFDVNPSTVADVFQDDLGVPDSTQWKLGRWNQTLGGGVGGFDQYAAVGAIARGNGYWVIARGGKTVDASGTSALPDAAVGDFRYATLTLRPGWNQIATPFAFPISWADRIESAPADIEDVVWAYQTGTAPPSYDNTVTILQPFVGYWVHNVGTVSRTLQLPYVEVTLGARKATPLVATPEQWRARLVLSGAGATDRASVVGIDPAARDGCDPLDFGRPPYPGGPFVSVVSLVPGETGGQIALAGDLRAPGAQGQRFALLVRGRIEGAATFALDPDSALPSGWAAALVEVADGRSFALDAGASLTLPRLLTPEGTRYDLLIGEAAWVLSQGGEPTRLPDRIALLPNYPNPFNPSTHIAFDLTAPTHARLEIFDLAGRRLVTLLDGQTPGGHRVVTWDGRDDRGRTQASGTFFCRLTAGGVTQTRPLTMLK
jgi:hypothetical protein